MPGLIQYSNTAGNTPSSLGNADIGINQADGKLYYRSSSGVVTQFTGSGSSGVVEAATASAFPATGAASTIYLDRSTNRMYRWASEGAYAEIGSLDSDSSNWSLLYPTAPTGVTGTTGNAQVALTWTAPTYTGTPITDYVIQFSSNSGSSWTTFSDGTSTATSATVTGLTNGTAYVFRVAAVNSLGTGSYSSASGSVTAGNDPYWSNVQLLIPGDSSTADVSSSARTVSAFGSAASSTSQKKWGAGSIAFNGSTDYLSVTASAFNVGTGDFTAEAWIRLSATPTDFRHVFDTRTADSNGFALGIDGSSRVFLFSNSAFRVQTGSVSINQWHHLAVCRASGVTRVYLNGSQLGSDFTNTLNYSQTTLLIGAYYSTSSFRWNGNLDDIRWTNTARYTGSSFSVPTAAFPTQ